MVQLWGGSGGGGAGSAVNQSTNLGAQSGTGFRVGEKGGKGGSGGYNNLTINVIPGTVYNFTLGVKGLGGQAVPNFGVSAPYTAASGSSGGSTDFNGLLFASGGSGGMGAFSGINTATIGQDGINGSSQNYDATLITVHTATTSSQRPYIPSGYVQNELVPSCCSSGGNGGNAGAWNGTLGVNTSPTNGSDGIDGYLIISY
jgi:hypothetical protein